MSKRFEIETGAADYNGQAISGANIRYDYIRAFFPERDIERLVGGYNIVQPDFYSPYLIETQVSVPPLEI